MRRCEACSGLVCMGTGARKLLLQAGFLLITTGEPRSILGPRSPHACMSHTLVATGMVWRDGHQQTPFTINERRAGQNLGAAIYRTILYIETPKTISTNNVALMNMLSAGHRSVLYLPSSSSISIAPPQAS